MKRPVFITAVGYVFLRYYRSTSNCAAAVRAGMPRLRHRAWIEYLAALASVISGPVDILDHSFGAACVLGAAWNIPQAMLDRLQTLPNGDDGRVAAAHTIPRELRQSHCYASNLTGLEQISAPTLFMLGENSPAFFRQTTETLHARLPNSQIVALPGQQHSAMLKAPELFGNEIIKFLA